MHLILVFDAYNVKGNPGSVVRYHNIDVVYTKEAETADQYIEKVAHQMNRKFRVRVATSDGLEQIIIRGAGCLLLSAKDLFEEIRQMNENVIQEHLKPSKGSKNYLLDHVSDEVADRMKQALEE